MFKSLKRLSVIAKCSLNYDGADVGNKITQQNLLLKSIGNEYYLFCQQIYIIEELVPGKSRSKKKKSTTATFWEGIF
jgi:hypothetical protein